MGAKNLALDPNLLALKIQELESTLEQGTREKQALEDQLQKVQSELRNMITAQGNLYRFQEKVERLKTIYAQIAEVGHEFNRTLDFEKIVGALNRFIIDHLNFERAALFLVLNGKINLHSYAGYYQESAAALKAGFANSSAIENSEGEVGRKIFSPENEVFAKLMSGTAKLNISHESKTTGETEFLRAFQLGEMAIYSLGRDAQGQLLGFLAVGNCTQHFDFHLRIEKDEETEALFSNLTSQIVAARNTVGFMQTIQHESAQVKRLLNNMRQAVFSVERQGKIVNPVSRFASEIFRMDLVGESVFSTLFKDLDPNSEGYSALQTVFATVFGEDSLQWELLDHMLPTRVQFEPPSADVILEMRTLKVGYAPIFDDKDVLEKIMFVIEDITELLKLEKQISEDQERIRIIQEIAATDTTDLRRNFFERTRRLYDRGTDLVPEFVLGGEGQGELMRILHTIKGNARMFGLKEISSSIHTAEGKLIQLKDQLVHADLPGFEVEAKTEESVAAVGKTIEIYGEVALKVFGIKNSFAEKQGSSGEIEAFAEIYLPALERLEKMVLNQPGANLDPIKKAMRQVWYVPVRGTLEKFIPMIQEVSESLEKIVHCKVEGEGALIDRPTFERIQDALVHLIRNAIDHGLESPQERKVAGKKEEGLLILKSWEEGDVVCISIKDDGRGIDGNHIANLALKKGLISGAFMTQLSEEEKRNLIFTAGFSSKEQATELSGRGVGLDIVKSTIESLGAELKLRSEIGKGTEFLVKIPLRDSEETEGKVQ